MKSRAHVVCVAAARLEKGFPVAPEAGLGPGRAAFQQTTLRGEGVCTLASGSCLYELNTTGG